MHSSKLLLPIVILLAFLSPFPSAFAFSGAIYVIERPDGSVTFTNKKPVAGRYSVLKSGKVSNASVLRTVPNRKYQKIDRDSLHSIIEQEADRAGIEADLVKAVIQVESGFNPQARSRKGAMGLMQLMPDTARFLGVRNPYHPHENVKGGVKYLSQLLEKYDGNLGLSLAAYNAGEYAVERYGGIPPFEETINYVKKVVKLWQTYRN